MDWYIEFDDDQYWTGNSFTKDRTKAQKFLTEEDAAEEADRLVTKIAVMSLPKAEV